MDYVGSTKELENLPLVEQFYLRVAKGLSGENYEEQRLRNKRRQAGQDPEKFCQIYLKHHFSEPFGEHHRDLFRLIKQAGTGIHAVRAEPREHGKSTTMLIGAVLYWLAYKKKSFILLIGAGAGAIGPHFLAMQSELDPDTGNQLLLGDFPHLRPAKDFKGQLEKWTDTKIKLASGATVAVATLYSGFRGIKEGATRPDAVILDDPQDEDKVSTAWKRERAVARVRNTILSLGSQFCDYIIEGNLMHKDSIVGTFLRDPTWDAKLYRAYNLPRDQDEDFPIGNTKEDGSPLWPQVWPRERLEAKQAMIGSRAFDLEFLNRDRPMGEVIYNSAEFKRFQLKPGQSLKGYDVLIYWDPSTGKKPGAKSTGSGLDPAAIVTVASKKIRSQKYQTPMRFYWVLDAVVERLSPEEQIDVALARLKRFPATQLCYENVGGFDVLIPFIRRRAKELGVRLPLRPVPQTQNKYQRIANEGMQMIIKTRTFFHDGLPVEYFRQWDGFPDPGVHDDGPDATVGAIERLERHREMF